MDDKRRSYFDAAGFYAALDATRQARSLTWKAVAEGARVSASTLSRMAQGKRPDLDGLAALSAWSGLQADHFVRSEKPRPNAEPLAVISAQLRQDDALTPEAATALDELIRTTYERLRRTNPRGEG